MCQRPSPEMRKTLALDGTHIQKSRFSKTKNFLVYSGRGTTQLRDTNRYKGFDGVGCLEARVSMEDRRQNELSRHTCLGDKWIIQTFFCFFFKRLLSHKGNMDYTRSTDIVWQMLTVPQRKHGLERHGPDKLHLQHLQAADEDSVQFLVVLTLFFLEPFAVKERQNTILPM